jgi:predicted transcriptional regulator
MNEIFNYPIVLRILEYFYKNQNKKMNILKISFGIQRTYCNIFQYLNSPILKDLIISEKIGRERVVCLTKKGMEIGKRIFEIGEMK